MHSFCNLNQRPKFSPRNKGLGTSNDDFWTVLLVDKVIYATSLGSYAVLGKVQ